MKKIILITLASFLFCTCKDEVTLFTEVPFASFYMEGAEWIHTDTTYGYISVDEEEEWIFHDTFRLGNQVNLVSSYIHESRNSRFDTFPPLPKTYQEVLARSSFAYRSTSGEPDFEYLYTDGEELSGWIRYEEDSLRLYALKKEGETYYEYLMTDYICVNIYPWYSDTCYDITIDDLKFKVLQDNVPIQHLCGIHLLHYRHLWDSKSRVRRLFPTVRNVTISSFKLRYNNKIYTLN
jgi:hypothetical protein